MSGLMYCCCCSQMFPGLRLDNHYGYQKHFIRGIRSEAERRREGEREGGSLCLYIYYLCFSLCMHFCRCVCLSLHTGDSTGIEMGRNTILCVCSCSSNPICSNSLHLWALSNFRCASVVEVCVYLWLCALLNRPGTQAPAFYWPERQASAAVLHRSSHCRHRWLWPRWGHGAFRARLKLPAAKLAVIYQSYALHSRTADH